MKIKSLVYFLKQNVASQQLVLVPLTDRHSRNSSLVQVYFKRTSVHFHIRLAFQDGGITNLVYRTFCSKITLALQAFKIIIVHYYYSSLLL